MISHFVQFCCGILITKILQIFGNLQLLKRFLAQTAWNLKFWSIWLWRWRCTQIVMVVKRNKLWLLWKYLYTLLNHQWEISSISGGLLGSRAQNNSLSPVFFQSLQYPQWPTKLKMAWRYYALSNECLKAIVILCYSAPSCNFGLSFWQIM